MYSGSGFTKENGDSSQKKAPTTRSRFDVLLCEQSECMNQKFYEKFPSLFDRQGESKKHIVNTKFKYPLCPIQEKSKRIPIHIQEKWQEEVEKLLSEGRITKLDKCTSDCSIAPIELFYTKWYLNLELPKQKQYSTYNTQSCSNN